MVRKTPLLINNSPSTQVHKFECACVYVCIYICVCRDTYVLKCDTHTHTYANTHTQTHTHTLVFDTLK